MNLKNMNSSPKKKTEGLLSVCIKAGKTVKGFDSVCSEVKNRTVFCVLTAADASDKTVKETEFICGSAGVPVLRTELSKAELGVLLRKETAVIAVCDRGFAEAFIKLLA